MQVHHNWLTLNLLLPVVALNESVGTIPMKLPRFVWLERLIPSGALIDGKFSI